MVKLRPEIEAMPAYSPGKRIEGKIKLASNENPLGPSPEALRVIGSYVSGIHLYPEGSSAILRRELASRHGISPDRIIVGNGSDEIIGLAAAAFLNPGQEVVIADHTFSEYAYASRLFGGVIRTVPLLNGRFDLPAVLAACTDKTKIVFLCSPNNPTGTIISQKEIVTLLEDISRDTMVLLDEAYADFVDDPEFHDSASLVARYPNLLVTRTFSKLFGLAGLRVGYGFGNETLIAGMVRAKPPFNVGSLGQAAATAALHDRAFIDKSLDMNRKGRQFLQQRVSELGLAYFPSHANFVCIETRRNAQEMFTAIADGGVTIRALTSFGLPSCIRVTIGTPEQNELFISALKQAIERIPESIPPYIVMEHTSQWKH